MPEIKESDLIEKYGSEIINDTDPIFYIGFKEVVDYECQLNVAKHYNLKIIVARNDVEMSVLKNMKETDKILHISDLKEKISIKGDLSNTILTKKEQRAMMIFGLISKVMGFDHNVFAVGDLMVTKNIIVDALGTEENIIDDDIVVLKDDLSKKVYVDRSIINKNKLKESDNESLDLCDYQFILSNFKMIVRQLSLLASGSTENNEERLLEILGNSL